MLTDLLARNRDWSASRQAQEPDYFTRLAAQQAPEYFWIGCSDSRVPANVVDLLITTGDISVGEEDHVKPTLQAMGADIAFSGVAIKPGKPVSFGHVRGTLWLGLPGNPLSAFITWQLFGEALVRRMTGESGQGIARRHVITSQAISRKPGRCEFRPAHCTGFDAHGREVVSFDPETHSSRVVGLSAASGLIYLPADAAFLPAGALVGFQPFCSN